jgi:hypothetical protein
LYDSKSTVEKIKKSHRFIYRDPADSYTSAPRIHTSRFSRRNPRFNYKN